MRLISWNVNGFRAVLKKGFEESFDSFQADIVCLQESKMQEGQAEFKKEGYHMYMHSAEKKGYSGTMVFTKQKPLQVFYEMGDVDTKEGRVLTLEFENFYLVNAYVPNAQDELKRIDFREAFEDNMRAYLKKLDAHKPVLYCGDLNVARNPIDLKRPKQNEGQPGYSEQERAKLELLLAENFVDTFRYFYPDKEDAYSWWSYRGNARANNVGWRIDYFIASERLMPQIKNAFILADVLGSDHCPVGVDIEL
ncbi:MAG: exodeoxyribonuclease III [Eubacteriales bacterium]|nr:exodeoxyribonuclease III [Eubacteriales bacterium]